MVDKKLINVVFINPTTGNNYQSLKSRYAAIEPPTWALLLAESMRKFGFNVSIIDANAEDLDNEKIFQRVSYLKLKASCVCSLWTKC